MSCNRKLQHVFGLPHWTDVNPVITKAYFEVKHTLGRNS